MAEKVAISPRIQIERLAVLGDIQTAITPQNVPHDQSSSHAVCNPMVIGRGDVMGLGAGVHHAET